jgi:L-lactate dehydrogenase (cytochrome)
MMFDYIDGGSFSEETLHRNRDDLRQIALSQRVMTDVSEISTATSLFGQDLSMPLLLGPVGLAGMYARRGEGQAARAAKTAGVPFCLSSVSICDLDEVTQASGVPPWFQLYMIKDTGYMTELLGWAKNIGSPALIFTVDLPVPSLRPRDFHTGLAGAPGLKRASKRVLDVLRHPAWAADVLLRGGPHSFGNFARGIPDAQKVGDFFAWAARNYEPKITWDNLAWLRRHWEGPILLKGILDPRDAAQAVKEGADGIIVSNHGGRQMDGVQSSIAALPRIVETVDRRVPVLMDGGIQSGTDILKALSLGADAALIGKAWAFALGAEGHRGVSQLLALMKQELEVAMALSGVTSLAQASDARA